MYSIYWPITKVVLVILGLWWCKEIFGRFREDATRMKESQYPGEKFAILFYWILTAGVITLIGNFVYSAVTNFAWAY